LGHPQNAVQRTPERQLGEQPSTWSAAAKRRRSRAKRVKPTEPPRKVIVIRSEDEDYEDKWVVKDRREDGDGGEMDLE
jgi:hypothetical protein